MKFKDRLNITNYDDNMSQETIDAVAHDRTAEQIIKDLLLKGQNIIAAGSFDCDKSVLTGYIKSILPDDDSCKTIYELSKDIKSYGVNHIIFPSPSISDIVKIFELILYGHNGFIFGLDIKEFNNIIESIKTLIMIYFPNLTDMGLNNLIGQSDTVIVYFKKNQDDKYFVNNIAQIRYTDNMLSLNSVYEIISEIDDNLISDNDLKETKKTKDISKKETDISLELDIEPAKKQVSQKINKYKLLKDKIKNKKKIEK